MNHETQTERNADGRHVALNVLVAEDNKVNQLLARKALMSAGHGVVIAENGQVAVDLLIQADHQFDLILMDRQMPVMDGLQATARIRELQSSGDLPAMPIVAVTAQDVDNDPNGDFPPVFDGYLVKPYSIADLVRVVEQQVSIVDPQNSNTDASASRFTQCDNVPFDIDALLDACMGNTVMAEHLIEAFRENGDECLSRIQDAIRSDDLATVRASAHSLKGSAGMLGANSVFRLATQLEDIDDSHSDVDRLVDELAEEFGRCREFQLAIV